MFSKGDACMLDQPAHAISLVGPFSGYIDRCRSVYIDGRPRQKLDQLHLHGFALGAIWIPVFLGREWRFLPECRKGDLAAAVLDLLAPYLVLVVALSRMT